jgi:heat shock protein 1/8
VIAKGCALQAAAISQLSSEEAAYISSTSSLSDPIISSQKAIAKPIGLLVPAPASNGSSSSSNPAVIDGKIFVTVVEANTPLPARRIVELPFPKGASSVKIPVYEGAEAVHVEAPPAATKKAPNGGAGSDDDYSDDEEDEEVRTLVIKPTTQLANVVVPVKGSGTVRVTIIVDKDGKTHVEAAQTGSSEVQKVEL